MKREASSGSMMPRMASSRAVTADRPSACASAAAAPSSCGLVFQVGGTGNLAFDDADRTHLSEFVVPRVEAPVDIHRRNLGKGARQGDVDERGGLGRIRVRAADRLVDDL